MTECPKLTNRTTDFITANTVSDLTVSTYNRTVGTKVNVSCSSSLGYYLTGDNTFTCQSNGQWSYGTKPICKLQSTPFPVSNELSNESKILVGVVVPIAAIVIIVLIILIVCVCRTKRSDVHKSRRQPGNEYPVPLSNYLQNEYKAKPHVIQTVIEDPVPLSNYSQREYYARPHVLESDIHKDYTTSVTRLQPAPHRYRYHDFYEEDHNLAAYKTREIRTILPANDYGEFRHTSERMEPIRSRDIYNIPFSSESSGRITKMPYVGEWVNRSTSGDLDLNDFNSDALRQGRDPLLWKNSFSNWGHGDGFAFKPYMKQNEKPNDFF